MVRDYPRGLRGELFVARGERRWGGWADGDFAGGGGPVVGRDAGVGVNRVCHRARAVLDVGDDRPQFGVRLVAEASPGHHGRHICLRASGGRRRVEAETKDIEDRLVAKATEARSHIRRDVGGMHDRPRAELEDSRRVARVVTGEPVCRGRIVAAIGVAIAAAAADDQITALGNLGGRGLAIRKSDGARGVSTTTTSDRYKGDRRRHEADGNEEKSDACLALRQRRSNGAKPRFEHIPPRKHLLRR